MAERSGMTVVQQIELLKLWAREMWGLEVTEATPDDMGAAPGAPSVRIAGPESAKDKDGLEPQVLALSDAFLWLQGYAAGHAAGAMWAERTKAAAREAMQ